MIGLGVCVFVAFFSAVLAYQRPMTALLFSVFLAPWQGLDMDIGLRVTAYQIVLLGTVIGVGSRAPFRRGDKRTVIPGAMWLYVAYCVGITALMLPMLPDMTVVGGLMRSPQVRPLAQLAVMFLLMSPLLLIPRQCGTWADIEAIGKAYILGCVALSVIGLGQVAVWYATGANPLPIGLINSLAGGRDADVLRSGQFEWDGSMVYRMNSLGGEPKDLGQGLVVGVLILWAGNLLLNRHVGRRTTVVSALLLLSVFLTQSTSAYALLAAGVLTGVFASFVMSARISKAAKRRVETYCVAGLTIALGGLLFVDTQRLGTIGEQIGDLMQERTTGRETYIEDADETVLSFLADQPRYAIFGTGMGTTHLFAMPYLPTKYAYYMQDTTLPFKSGILKIIAETGAIGLLLFIAAVYSFVSPLARGTGIGRDWCAAVGVAVLVIVVFYLLRTYVFYQLFLGLGCALAARAIGRDGDAVMARTRQRRHSPGGVNDQSGVAGWRAR